jgi:hypothetical protein
VVQLFHLEKYEFVNGKDDIPFMKWKIKAMFETTNQQRTAGIFKRSGLFSLVNWYCNWI